MEGGIDYRTALFEPETIARLSRCFGALIEGVAASPDMALVELAATLDEFVERDRRAREPASDAGKAPLFARARPILVQSRTDGT
jgi:hypothetical protein